MPAKGPSPLVPAALTLSASYAARGSRCRAGRGRAASGSCRCRGRGPCSGPAPRRGRRCRGTPRARLPIVGENPLSPNDALSPVKIRTARYLCRSTALAGNPTVYVSPSESSMAVRRPHIARDTRGLRVGVDDENVDALRRNHAEPGRDVQLLPGRRSADEDDRALVVARCGSRRRSESHLECPRVTRA